VSIRASVFSPRVRIRRREDQAADSGLVRRSQAQGARLHRAEEGVVSGILSGTDGGESVELRVGQATPDELPGHGVVLVPSTSRLRPQLALAVEEPRPDRGGAVHE
jgi:hypothetical protein